MPRNSDREDERDGRRAFADRRTDIHEHCGLA